MAHKYVYLFSEGNANMRNLLGGKGANLAEMTNIGLPVPQGFTITTEACTQYYEDGRQINAEITAQIMEYIEKMEEITGKKFGDLENPLLVSVRSGARASMPGMMDTILNLGLNEQVVEVLAEKSGNPRWAWDCYRRFIQMYSDVVMEVGKKYFEVLIDQMKEKKGVKLDVELTAEDLKELAGQLLEILGGELDVQLDALLFLHLVNENFEVLLADFHDDIGVHLDEAAIAVPGPAGIAGLLCQNLDDLLVQAQVQDGVHHAGHGGAGTGTHGNQQRILQIAELLAGDLFHLLDVLHDLRGDLGVDLAAILVVLGAGFGRDGETLGHRQTNVGHLGQVGALAAQQVSHVRVAFAEQIYILVCHVDPPTKNSNSLAKSRIALYYSKFWGGKASTILLTCTKTA